MISDTHQPNWEKIIEMTGDPYTVRADAPGRCEFYWKVDGVQKTASVPNYYHVAPWNSLYTEASLELIKQAIDLANGASD